MRTTPLLRTCIDAFGGDVDMLLVPDPRALQAATLPGTPPVTAIRYDARGGFSSEAGEDLEVSVRRGRRAEGNSVLVGAILRDWLLSYPVRILSFEWSGREETEDAFLKPEPSEDREWIEAGRFLRDFDAMVSDHASEFPESPGGFVFEFILGERELDAKMRRPKDLPNLCLPHPNVFEVFCLCWGMRARRRGTGTLSLRLWIPDPRGLSAHEKLEGKARWAEAAG